MNPAAASQPPPHAVAAPRRKELKQIATGLQGAFMSRNNDVGGYWGIGMLCRHAQQCGSQWVEIDLLNAALTPPSPSFAPLLVRYRAMLARRLAARALPADWVRAVTLTLDFRPEPPPGRPRPASTWGSLFALTVAITDDTGRRHQVVGWGHCAPHDPGKEVQSSRAQAAQACLLGR